MTETTLLGRHVCAPFDDDNKSTGVIVGVAVVPDRNDWTQYRARFLVLAEDGMVRTEMPGSVRIVAESAKITTRRKAHTKEGT